MMMPAASPERHYGVHCDAVRLRLAGQAKLTVSRRSVLYALLMATTTLLTIACWGQSDATLGSIPGPPDGRLIGDADDLVPGLLNATLEKLSGCCAFVEARLGVAGATERKTYALLPDAKWDDITTFYSNTLTGDGWDALTETSTRSDAGRKVAAWQKGDQYVSVIMITSLNALVIALTSNHPEYLLP